MGALDQAEAQRLQNAHLGLASYTAPTTPIMQRLMSSNGSASSNGTQVTGGSYAAQSLSAALPASSTNGSISTNAAISYTGMPATTTVGVEWWDSAGSPRRQAWGALSASKTTGAGDTLTVASGSASENLNA
ncbi:phage tail fiber protein [Dactylosporangium sp. CA-139066]|uniref:phage tail fiber protein n=1 Tax=Dactylosporangium sp. CA-139066 TaxID=3239930 RepID=UPI003D8BA09B